MKVTCTRSKRSRKTGRTRAATASHDVTPKVGARARCGSPRCRAALTRRGLPCSVGPAKPARASRIRNPRDERSSGGRAVFCASMLGRNVLPKVRRRQLEIQPLNYLRASGCTRACVSFRVRGALSGSPPRPGSCQASCEALGLLLLYMVPFTMLLYIQCTSHFVCLFIPRLCKKCMARALMR